jgi:hypothetical protein
VPPGQPSELVPALPTTITPIEKPSPKKKIGFRKVIVGFGVFLLLIGAISTILLVQRNQDIRRDASSGKVCQQSSDCMLLDNPGNSGSYQTPRQIAYIDITNQTEFRYTPGNTNDGCYNVSIQGNQLTWSKVGSGNTCKDISNIQIWMTNGTTPTPTNAPSLTPTGTTGTVTPTQTTSITPTVPSGVTASCGAVEAYDTNWNKLANSELSQLQTGDIVRFTVKGTTTNGSFDKAKFTINGTALSETLSKKPGTDIFYSEYTIPTGVLSFNVTAQVHHTSLGWF